MTTLAPGGGKNQDLDGLGSLGQADLIGRLDPTASQHELWIASKLGGDDANRSFNECLSLTLRGNLNVELLEGVLQCLTDRHQALRCSFTSDGQHLTVLSAQRHQLDRRDLSSLAEPARALALADLRRNEVGTPFNLERAPLYRTSLVQLEPELHQLIFTAHHAVCDSWSIGVLMGELAALYRAGARIWPTRIDATGAGLLPATSFASYAAAWQARAESDEGARDEEFWVNRLSGDLKQMDLPTDRPRPSKRSYDSHRLDLELPAHLLAPLRQLGAEASHTLLVTLMGAFQAWLYRLTGQRDLILGLPLAGQAAVGAGSLVGHCVHVLPIRMQVDPAASLPAHLASLKPVMRDAFAAQQVTFSSLLRKLNLPFDRSRVPLIPVCMNLDGGPGELDFGDLAVAADSVPRAFESFELFVNAVDHRDRLVIEWSYNAGLFDESTIRRWMKEFETLVADAIARPETPVKHLSVLCADEIELLARLNATRRPIAGIPVHDQVAAQARARPGHPAVVFHDRSLSYRDLDRQADQLARHLRGEGIHEGDCVGVYLERSEQLPVALLGVLKCGAAYVPMDPGYPAERLQMMAEDGGVRLVVTESGLLSRLPKIERSVCIDRLPAPPAVDAEEPLAISVKGEDRAYVLFTSGSTGRPKGVEIPHRALTNFLASMQREPGFGADDRILAVTTVSFDIAGLELFLPLVAGGTIVLADRAEAADPEALVQRLERDAITIMQATPATWRMLIDSGWKGQKRLRVLCGGEALAPGLAAELSERAGEVWNMYGPTETTVWSTVKQMARDERVTIGRPIDNTTVYILDEDRGRVPVGATGEIWIGGEGVALGYMGRAELTRERFIDDPFAPGERMYRTGDLGRVLPDGNLECLGRGDSQVKIRGFRIELGEIETAIERLEGVRKAVVQLVQRGQAAELCAYWVADPGISVDASALKVHLKKTLPPYMLPQHYVPLTAWALTPAGKVDRKALPMPGVYHAHANPRSPSSSSSSSSSSSAEALRDDVDVAVAEIWQDLLGVGDIQLNDDFFALGGQSILAVRFVAAVKARFSVPFKLEALFAGSSLREVSDTIRGGGGHFERGAVALRRESGAPRVFFICGVQLYRAAALSMGEGVESYGVVISADELLEEALRTNVPPTYDVPVLVSQYLAAIRRLQPQGPYRLAGVSFGGVLAYEVARALKDAGDDVPLLALLDPVLPSAMRRSFVGQLEHLKKIRVTLDLGLRVTRKLLGAARKREAPKGAEAADRLGRVRDIAYDNAIAAWDKNPQPYPGDAVLFRAADLSDYRGRTIASDLGWRRLVRGKLDIHELSGSHLSILQPPNVHRLATIMRQYVLSPRPETHRPRLSPAGSEMVASHAQKHQL